MTTQPQWESVGNYTTDLLELVAQGSPATPTADAEWAWWLAVAEAVAHSNAGLIDPNELRRRVRGEVAPKRLGAYTNRALSRGLIEPAGWVISTDTEGRNAGRPVRSYLWLGAR